MAKVVQLMAHISAFGKSSASKQAGKNRRAAKQAMRMAHQWEVEDLEKAGLNPILSAHGGGGVISGSGSGATSAQELAALAGAAGTLGSGAQKGATLKAEVKTAKEVAKKAEADTDAAGSNAEIRNTERETAKNQRDQIAANIALIHQQQATNAQLAAKYAQETRLLDKKQPGGSVGELIDTKVFEFLNTGAARPGKPSPINRFRTSPGPGMMKKPGFVGDPQKFRELMLKQLEQ